MQTLVSIYKPYKLKTDSNTKNADYSNIINKYSGNRH